jgi:DNA-binding winged helix-turn-helix (wHTH) protein
MEIISFFPSFVLDITNRCLLRDSEKVALRPKSFAILRYLVEHAHHWETMVQQK